MESNGSGSSINPTEYAGMWQFPTKPNICCIYRVPHSIRRVNPEAYTPQLVLIGPLYHSLKSQALNSRGDITNTKSMGYLNMEAHKKIYLYEFTRRVGANTISELKSMIEDDEMKIRDSYSESTAWIPSPEFVNMVLHDSIFIIEFLLRTFRQGLDKTGDPLIDELCLETEVKKDLILLENQLPYFILKKLYAHSSAHIVSVTPNGTFRQLIMRAFGCDGTILNVYEFLHFTDLFRRVRVETLEEHDPSDFNEMKGMYNADKLHSGGVKFEALENKFPLYAKFEYGCLKMPHLLVDDGEEMRLRNIMAYEQCHFPFHAHVCNYIVFLDYLIDTEKDVDLLVENGIITNCIGKNSSVAEMVNKLSLGISYFGSYYSDIAVKVNAHYSNPYNSTRIILERVYFGNLWIGMATVAAMLLLLFTLIQAVASIIELTQKKAS